MPVYDGRTGADLTTTENGLAVQHARTATGKEGKGTWPPHMLRSMHPRLVAGTTVRTCTASDSRMVAGMPMTAETSETDRASLLTSHSALRQAAVQEAACRGGPGQSQWRAR